jgi:hypothetical protein
MHLKIRFAKKDTQKYRYANANAKPINRQV